MIIQILNEYFHVVHIIMQYDNILYCIISLKLTVVDAEKVKEDMKAKRVKDTEPQTKVGEEMEVEGARVYNKKTLLDQYGNYPVWMSHRKIMKHKKGRAKTQKATKMPGKRLTRRQKKTKKEKSVSS